MTETPRVTPGDARRLLVEKLRALITRCYRDGQDERRFETLSREEEAKAAHRMLALTFEWMKRQLEAVLSSEAEAPRPHPVLLEIAGLVNSYHNDGSTITAGETLAAIARALGEPMSMEAPRHEKEKEEDAGLLGNTASDDSQRPPSTPNDGDIPHEALLFRANLNKALGELRERLFGPLGILANLTEDFPVKPESDDLIDLLVFDVGCAVWALLWRSEIEDQER